VRINPTEEAKETESAGLSGRDSGRFRSPHNSVSSVRVDPSEEAKETESAGLSGLFGIDSGRYRSPEVSGSAATLGTSSADASASVSFTSGIAGSSEMSDRSATSGFSESSGFYRIRSTPLSPGDRSVRILISVILLNGLFVNSFCLFVCCLSVDGHKYFRNNCIFFIAT
jgi:hypothetical protein